MNTAAFQAKEGDLKISTDLLSAIKTANAVTIAHFLKTSTHILADGSALAAQLNTLLQYGCLQKPENFVVTDTGTQSLLTAGTDDACSMSVDWCIGIYFLIRNGQVSYVGQTGNVLDRLARHKRNGKLFDAYAFIPCLAEQLDELEKTYTVLLFPEENMRLY